MRRCNFLIAGLWLAALGTTVAPAQSIYGTLTGIVSDQSQAVIAKATVRLRDQQSGSQREAITNAEGYYSLVSIPPGAYQLTVTIAGFETYTQSGIAILGGDKINLNVVMKVGNTQNTVEVRGDVDLVTPVDSGEKSDRLTAKELENFIQVGTNAAEFIKIMPGFAINNGTSNMASYRGESMGINGNGDGGSQSPLNNAYSYNGLPTNSLDITADGAHVSDPGCNCATPVNPNSNMISEFKISISNFNAESQKGPGVISSVAKSGGQQYHGSAFITAKNAVMNSNDWLNNYSRVKRPETAYYFPGMTLGGPVKLPFTNFNKNKDKLFFFTGIQYYFQTQDTGLLRSSVPTEGMRNGIFTPEELAKMGRITASGAPSNPLNARGQTTFPGNIIPASQFDPNMKALLKNYPMPNADPDSTGGYNYVDQLQFRQNNVQWMSRVDYSVSDYTKVFVRYNLQRETQLFPIGLWSSSRTQQLPYPSRIQGNNRSDSVTAGVTKVLNPSMANEFVFGYTFIGFPNVFETPEKVDRKSVGFNVQGLFKNGVAQIPNIGASGELAGIGTNGGFEVGGPGRGLYANKFMPSLSDTVSKMWRTHTFKAGFFWEWIRNSQPASNNTQGVLSFNNGQSNSMGNAYADLLIGNLNSYNETSFNRINDVAYNTYEGFIQDSWKVTRRLSVEIGLRVTHFGPWYDYIGFGFPVFDYSKYSPSCRPTDYCGFLWNKRDPSVPLGGFPTRFLNYQPRMGVAYSLGNNTVLRGGWGRYYYHSAQFTAGLNVSSGMQTVTRSNNQGIGGNTPLRVSDIDSIDYATTALAVGGVSRTDDRSPYTDSYSFTISQRVPWHGLLEVAYVGNQSKDLLIQNGWRADINLVPPGAMLANNNDGRDPNSLTADNFRPLRGFSGLPLANHGSYANYNSLQVKYIRTRGNAIINANYTYGKAMGIISTTLDSFNLDNNYSVQANNRPHIFNLAYSYTMKQVSKNKLAGGLLNYWQVSGIVQWQSGPNLTGQWGQNFGMALNGYKVPETNQNISAASLLGTPNIGLTPILTCDPGANLADHQFINPNCFAFPKNIGENGATTLPVWYGPAYFNTDLGLFKNFRISERQRLQFQVNGFNFLNHPLWSFNNSNRNLGFNGTTGLVNTPLFGTVTTKQGRRVIQLKATYTF
ncbi:MAG: carboxypeptidase regulatory-like domain-containing protein [Bryobacteraceae bacterium]